MKSFFLTAKLLLASFCFGQNNLEFKIISINRIENKFKTEYTYEINYSIKNINPKEISFFLNKNKIASNTNGSLSNAVIYRFYQNDNVINAPIFNLPKELNPIEKEKKRIETLAKIDSIYREAKLYKNNTEYFLNKRKEELLSQIVTMKANEVITMKSNLNWNKLRNISFDDNEYYLNKNTKYHLDFSIYLLKKPFEKYFTEKEKVSIIQNPNFIEENYTSEKFEIFLD